MHDHVYNDDDTDVLLVTSLLRWHMGGVVFIKVRHVALHLAHGVLHAGIIKIRQAIGHVAAGRGLGRTFQGDKLADLLDHPPVAALRAHGLAGWLESLGQKLKNLPARRAGIFKNRHD